MQQTVNKMNLYLLFADVVVMVAFRDPKRSQNRSS